MSILSIVEIFLNEDMIPVGESEFKIDTKSILNRMDAILFSDGIHDEDDRNTLTGILLIELLNAYANLKGGDQ